MSDPENRDEQAAATNATMEQQIKIGSLLVILHLVMRLNCHRLVTGA